MHQPLVKYLCTHLLLGGTDMRLADHSDTHAYHNLFDALDCNYTNNGIGIPCGSTQ